MNQENYLVKKGGTGISLKNSIQREKLGLPNHGSPDIQNHKITFSTVTLPSLSVCRRMTIPVVGWLIFFPSIE